MKQVYGVEKTPELAKTHAEIQHYFAKLCVTLDTLSHHHYTPEPVTVENKNDSKVTSIEMEENIPIAASDTTLLAPHKVLKQPLSIKGPDEYTPKERKALRHRIKAKVANKHIADSNDPAKKVKANKQSKSTTGALSALKADKNVIMLKKDNTAQTVNKVSSASFFRTMQAEAEAGKNGTNTKKKKNKTTALSSSQLKL